MHSDVIGIIGHRVADMYVHMYNVYIQIHMAYTLIYPLMVMIHSRFIALWANELRNIFDFTLMDFQSSMFIMHFERTDIREGKSKWSRDYISTEIYSFVYM